jgi:hypothetical protein
MSNPFTNTEQVNAVIKVRRGPEVDREQVIYEDGELVYSTDKKRLFIGDNENEGGNLVGNKVWYVDSFDKLPEIQINDLVFRTDLRAFYLLYTNNYLLTSSYALVGGVKLITDNVNLTPYTLPDATTTNKGGITVGDGLTAFDGLVSINYDPNVFVLDVTNKLTLKAATAISLTDATYNSKGIVQISDGVTFTEGGLGITNGVVSVNIDNETIKLNPFNTLYVDPLIATKPATNTVIGGVKIGKALSATSDGTLDVLIDNNTIKIDGANQLYVAAGGGGGGTTTSFTLNDGTSDLVGVDTLTIGTGLELDSSGILSLPIATTSGLGGVKIGNNGALNKTGSGLISVNVDNTSIKINSATNALTFEPNALSAIFLNSKSQNGYIAIGGDIALQWGKASFASSTTATITFPAGPFSTACYVVLATQTGATGTPVAIRTSGITNSSATLNIAAAATMDCFWIAIGDK